MAPAGCHQIAVVTLCHRPGALNLHSSRVVFNNAPRGGGGGLAGHPGRPPAVRSGATDSDVDVKVR